MNPAVDSRYLRSVGRNVQVPFRVKLGWKERNMELLCTRVVRVLPAKRLVCYGKWGDKEIVAKFFLDSRHAKKHSARELKGIRALQEAGITTPEFLFEATLPPDRTPVLGFKRIVSSLNLAEIWDQAPDDDYRLQLLRRAAVVIAALHNAGLKQDDPHFKNLLVNGEKIYAIDGDLVDTRHKGRPLAWRKSLKNLAYFFAQIPPLFEQLTAEAFKVYAEQRGWALNESMFRLLDKNIHKRRHLRKQRYLRKIFRECTEFTCRKSWKRVMVVRREFEDEAMLGFVADPDASISSSRLLKDGRSSTIGFIKVGNKGLMAKRYNIKDFAHSLRRCFRPTRASVSWVNAHRLRLIGIPTPMPIAFVEKRWGPFRSTSYFISEYIEGINAHEFFRSGQYQAPDLSASIEHFISLFQSLADARVSHGDMKATNFILAENKIFVTDLDSMREHRFEWLFRRAFKRDIKRFMKNWEGLPEVANDFQKRLSQLRF